MKASSANDFFCSSSYSGQLYQKKYHLLMSINVNRTDTVYVILPALETIFKKLSTLFPNKSKIL